MRPLSFSSKLVVFTLAFFVGTLLAVLMLIIIKTACFSPAHFWARLLDGIQFILFPVALAETVRSPLMGLLFALLGRRNLGLIGVVRFASVCGACAYFIADAVNLAGFAPWSLAPDFRQPTPEYIMLGLPVGFILVSRVWWVVQ